MSRYSRIGASPSVTTMWNIRAAADSDRESIWRIFHAVVARGDTYVFDPGISRDDALLYWFNPSHHCFVAERNGSVAGTYIVKANQPGLGSHVANAAFMVAPRSQGSGVGRAMAEHCLAEARRLGFRAMQFNFVVSTNAPAVRLWQKLGFEIVGTLPKAFRHANKGFVDAYVMFRSLDDGDQRAHADAGHHAAMSPIESATMRLEPLAAVHAEEMFLPMSAAAIYDYIPGGPPASVAALRERYTRLERGRSADGVERWLNWIVRLRSGACAGFVQATIHPSAMADFAFVFAPEHWGRGVAFEACSAVLPHLAQDFGVRALFATVDPRNARSIRLLQRLGFGEVTPQSYAHGAVEPNDGVFALDL